MPARLHFSNSLDALADRLLANLAEQGGDLLAAPAIATPASALRDWLKIRIAEKTGIAAGLAFPHLENLLWDRLAERDRFREASDRQPARLLDSFGFQGLVLAQLRRDPPPELKNYLQSAEPEDAARRLCQLAGRLASLFREYEYNRVAENGFPGVAESWMRGEPCFERHLLRGSADHPARARQGEVRALEAWQMAVYRALFREGDGLRDRWGEATGTYRYTLPQYAGMALGDPLPPLITQDPPVFHLFGLSNISPFHRDLIGRLADEDRLGNGAAHFEIYALNPCAEFWEDALTLKERRARAPRRLASAPVPPPRVAATRPDADERESAAIRDEKDENGLLALFGKPGRETIKLWCQLTDYAFFEDFREPAREPTRDPAGEPENGSLLAAARRSVLRRSAALDRGDRRAPDASLRIRFAPDARSEMEAVRAEAAELLRARPDLRPEDLAVIPADLEASLPLLRAVFAGGPEAPGNAPVLLPDAGTPEESPLLRGFRDLLALAPGSADRRAVLAFLDNPAALRKAGLEAARLPAIRAFLEAAGFQEGWDAENVLEGGAGGNSTARAAGERALLALALDPDDDALDGTGLWPARDTATRLERAEIARLLEWMESLRETLRPLRDGAARSFAEWARLLRGLRDAFLEAGPEDARAELELRRFLDDLEQWGTWNEGGNDNADAGTHTDRAPAEVVVMLFGDRFRGAGETGRSVFLRGGIRTGNLSALRGLPFRHVWVTGLSAAFPAPGEAAPLDLRGYRRLPGETDPAARDLYALLEVIAATTESLSLSWPRHDVRGNEQQPSRALTGLAAWLESDLLPEGSRCEFAAMQTPPPVPPVPETRRPVAWAEEPPRAAQDGQFADWRDLREYLNNPAAHAATRHFRLRAWDALDYEEEDRSAALFLEGREDNALIDAALRAELLEPGSGRRAFERRWTPRARGGLVPPPPWGGIEEARLRDAVAGQGGEIAKTAAALRGFLNTAGLHFAGSLRLGPQGSETPEPPVLTLPAFDASPLGVPLRVGGILPWFFHGEGQDGGWALLVEDGREFPAWLIQLCATALNSPEPLRDVFRGHARLFVRARNSGRIREHLLEPLDPADARRNLQALLADFARAPDFDDLPLARIETAIKDAEGVVGAVGDWSAAIEDARREEEDVPRARAAFTDRLLRALGPRVPDDAGAKIARRVLPYLEWKARWSKGGGASEKDTEIEA